MIICYVHLTVSKSTNWHISAMSYHWLALFIILILFGCELSALTYGLVYVHNYYYYYCFCF